VLSGLW
jgi:hypothetical protein